MSDSPLPSLQALADRLCAEHGIAPVEVVVNRRLRRLAGRATYDGRRVEIAAWVLARPAEAEGTLRHEVAHVLARDRHPKSSAHGREWKQAALAVGASPVRVFDAAAVADFAPFRWIYRCGKGCEIFAYRRRPSLERRRTVCVEHARRFARTPVS